MTEFVSASSTLLESSAPVTVEWDVKTAIAYALGAGARPDEDLEHIYEGRGPVVLPSLASALALRWLPTFNAEVDGGPYILRAQAWTLLGPLPAAGRAQCRWRIDSAATDRGTELVVAAELVSDGECLARSRSTVFSRTPNPSLPRAAVAPRVLRSPRRRPDAQRSVTLSPQQTAIFRLTLPLDPERRPSDAMHIDPDVAGPAGFAVLPLHGPAVEGLLLRAALGAGMPLATPPVSMQTEFRRPAFAGAELRLDVWCEPDGGAVVEALNPNRQQLAIAHITPVGRHSGSLLDA